MTLPQFAALSAVAALLMAGLHDLAVRTVPNWLVAATAASGVAVALLEHRLLASALAALLLLACAAALWLRGCMGGADAKLIGAAGLLVPPAALPLLVAATALAGGLLAVPYLPGRRLFARPAPGRPTSMAARLLRCERWRLSRRGPLPYAVAIAAGTLFVLLQQRG